MSDGFTAVSVGDWIVWDDRLGYSSTPRYEASEVKKVAAKTLTVSHTGWRDRRLVDPRILFSGSGTDAAMVLERLKSSVALMEGEIKACRERHAARVQTIAAKATSQSGAA